MPPRTAHLALAAALVASGPAGAGERGPERPVRTHLCADDLPEGAHLPPQPGCAAPGAPPAARGAPGAYDLGGGTSVRVGGRAGAEFGARR